MVRVEMLDGTWVEVPETEIGKFLIENKGKFKYQDIPEGATLRQKVKSVATSNP